MVEALCSNLLWVYGTHVVYVLVIGGVISYFIWRPFAYAIVGMFILCFLFFRNPERICYERLHNPAVIVCPADGTVVESVALMQPYEHYTHKVSIFLSIFNVHVQWTPIEGTVRSITYKPGQFLLAWLPKSSVLNERNDLVIVDTNGRSIMVRQIAGTIARSIECWAHVGQQLKVGDTLGMIRFGSRVDIFLPDNVTLAIGVGQRVYGGQTVLGYWH